jgi:hypothetical protein
MIQPTPLIKFEGETTLKSFITSTCLSIERIYSEIGSEGYYRKWRRDFPIKDYKKLLQLAQSFT